MKIVLIAVFCCISYGVTTQTQDAESTLTLIPPQQSNWNKLPSSHQTLNEVTKAKRDKFLRILNQLKTVLSEELENSQYKITEDSAKESVISSINNVMEEQKMRIGNESKLEEGMKENETDQNLLYQNVITKIGSAFTKSQNGSIDQKDIEMPNMIPIFRPRQASSRNELNQNIPDPATTVKKLPKSRAVSFVPEKIIQTNITPIPSKATFKIPCQRAADILDMTNFAIPKQAVLENNSVKSKVNPTVQRIKPNLPMQSVPAPVTLSVDSADSEDAVAMLFKPKNISLMQLYGNLLKKITITVLVPYHMSKLGGN